MNMKEIITDSPEMTVALGEKIAKILKKGDLLALNGDLGAGKTMFVKGIAKGLGYPDSMHVNSPTFVIMKEYRCEVPLYHFDVYRLSGEEFADTVEYKTYFYGKGITVVEWAERISDILPDEYLEVKIMQSGMTERRFVFNPHGKHFENIAMKV